MPTPGLDTVVWRISSYPVEITIVCGEARGDFPRNGYITYVNNRRLGESYRQVVSAGWRLGYINESRIRGKEDSYQ